MTTYHKKIQVGSSLGVNYLADGNPAIHAGLFDEHGKRLAWWPAGYTPTQQNVERVMIELVLKREDETPVPREAIRRLLKRAYIPDGKDYP